MGRGGGLFALAFILPFPPLPMPPGAGNQLGVGRVPCQLPSLGEAQAEGRGTDREISAGLGAEGCRRGREMRSRVEGRAGSSSDDRGSLGDPEPWLETSGDVGSPGGTGVLV